MAWSQEQLRNASIIAQVGRQLGASNRDIQIALMTAIVESGLRNLNYGDRDSIGMFQQRDAWGSRADRLDPYKSAKMFFLGGAAGQRGLFDFGNRNKMTMGAAAQAVQVSAFPDRYAQQQNAAAKLMKSVGGKGATAPEPTLGDIPGVDELVKGSVRTAPLTLDTPSVTEANGVGEITADEVGIGESSFGIDNPQNSPVASPNGMPLDPWAGMKMPTLQELGVKTSNQTTWSPDGTTQYTDGPGNDSLVNYAKKFLGTPYVWGGTSPSGFDCSGFVQYVYKKFGKNLPRLSADQARAGARVDLGKLKPGDLVAWDNSSRNNGADHIAIYIGRGLIIEAPRPGSSVRITKLYDTGRAWGVRM